MSIIRRITGRVEQSTQSIREIIGRSVSQVDVWQSLRQLGRKSIDQSLPDYEFWDKFRRGRQQNFELASLMARPITQIISSWVLGAKLDAKLVDSADDPDNENDPRNYTDDLLRRLMKRLYGWLLTLFDDLYALGDQYVIVNPDGSFSVPSPETVKVTYAPLDYRQPIQYTVTTELDEATVIDEYRADGRTLTIKWKNAAHTIDVFEYQNLIGRIPVVHFANERGTNETHGRPVYEALYHLFGRYDDLVDKLVGGAEVAGNPIPVFEGMEDIQATIAANNPTVEEVQDDNGNFVERVRIVIDRAAAIFVGGGGQFNLKSPARGFTEDVRNALKALFLLVLEHSRIPEVVWGNELSSSRATAGEQMLSFFKFIEGRRSLLEGEGSDDVLDVQAHGGLLELLDIWLRTRALVDPRVVVAPVTLEWDELSQEDQELHFEKTKYAHTSGLVTDATALDTMDLVPDAQREVDKAAVESEERQSQPEREAAAFPAAFAAAQREATNGNGRQAEAA